jgi:hypothetical protein
MFCKFPTKKKLETPQAADDSKHRRSPAKRVAPAGLTGGTPYPDIPCLARSGTDPLTFLNIRDPKETHER